MFKTNPNKTHSVASSSNIPVDPQATTTSHDPVSMEQAWAALFSYTASLDNTGSTALPKNTEDPEWAKAAEMGFGSKYEDIWSYGIKPSASASSSNIPVDPQATTTSHDPVSMEQAWAALFSYTASLDNTGYTALPKNTEDPEWAKAAEMGFGSKYEDIWSYGIKPSASATATEAALNALLAQLTNEAKVEGSNVVPPPSEEGLPWFNETLPASAYLEELSKNIAKLEQEQGQGQGQGQGQDIIKQDTASPSSTPHSPSTVPTKNPEQNSSLPINTPDNPTYDPAFKLWKKIQDARQLALEEYAPKKTTHRKQGRLLPENQDTKHESIYLPKKPKR